MRVRVHAGNGGEKGDISICLVFKSIVYCLRVVPTFFFIYGIKNYLMYVCA